MSVHTVANSLQDKVIVVTSGADGIGCECALAYAREGATVAVLDRNYTRAVETATKLGTDHIAVHSDVSDGPVASCPSAAGQNLAIGVFRLDAHDEPCYRLDYDPRCPLPTALWGRYRFSSYELRILHGSHSAQQFGRRQGDWNRSHPR